MKSVLNDGKLLLKFATLSIIESLRSNPELCNFVLNDISTNNDTDRSSYGSNSLSLISGGQQQERSFNDSYTALILEESEKLYNQLKPELTNRVIAAVVDATDIKASSLPISNNKQKLTHKNITYETE